MTMQTSTSWLLVFVAFAASCSTQQPVNVALASGPSAVASAASVLPPSIAATANPGTGTAGTGTAKTPQPGYVGQDHQIPRNVLRFSSDAAAKTYDQLEACLTRNDSEFYAYPRRVIGNSVSIEWCRGKGAHINCGGGNTRESVGAGWSELDVYHYPQEWPQVFGLTFSIGDFPKENGIGVSLDWSEGGKSVRGTQMTATFKQIEAGEPVLKLVVGMEDEFPVGEAPIRVKAAGSPAEVYNRLRASPASLRLEIETRFKDLEAAVDTALAADTPRKCIYGAYTGRGIPPACEKKVPLSASEKSDVRTKLTSFLTPRRELVAKQSAIMHQAFVALLPERCWAPTQDASTLPKVGPGSVARP